MPSGVCLSIKTRSRTHEGKKNSPYKLSTRQRRSSSASYQTRITFTPSLRLALLLLSADMEGVRNERVQLQQFVVSGRFGRLCSCVVSYHTSNSSRSHALFSAHFCAVSFTPDSFSLVMYIYIASYRKKYAKLLFFLSFLDSAWFYSM